MWGGVIRAVTFGLVIRRLICVDCAEVAPPLASDVGDDLSLPFES